MHLVVHAHISLQNVMKKILKSQFDYNASDFSRNIDEVLKHYTAETAKSDYFDNFDNLAQTIVRSDLNGQKLLHPFVTCIAKTLITFSVLASCNVTDYPFIFIFRSEIKL